MENLVVKAKKGDKRAKLEILKRLKPLVLSSIRSYHTRGDYDDLIQEGNLTILEALETYQLEYGVYFLGYVKLKLKYHYLNRRREPSFSLNMEDQDGLEAVDLLEGDFDLEEDILERELSSSLVDYINLLPRRQGEIVYKFYLEELELVEIANQLGLSYQTVANTKTRAIKKLRRLVKKS